MTCKNKRESEYIGSNKEKKIRQMKYRQKNQKMTDTAKKKPLLKEPLLEKTK